MTKLIIYPAVYLGMLSLPALFFAGLYLLRRKSLKAGRRPARRWLAALAYSAAVLACWWAAYFFGDLLPWGSTDNALASLSLMFGYSAYALLPAAAITAAASLAGVLVCVARDLGLRGRKV